MMIRSNKVILIVGGIVLGLCAALHAGSRGANRSRPGDNFRVSTPGGNSYINAGRGEAWVGCPEVPPQEEESSAAAWAERPSAPPCSVGPAVRFATRRGRSTDAWPHPRLR